MQRTCKAGGVLRGKTCPLAPPVPTRLPESVPACEAAGEALQCLNHQKAAAERGPRPLVAKLRRRGAGAPPPHVRQFATLMRQPCPSQASAQQMHAGRSAAPPTAPPWWAARRAGMRWSSGAAASPGPQPTELPQDHPRCRRRRPQASKAACWRKGCCVGCASVWDKQRARPRSCFAALTHLRLVHSPQWLSRYRRSPASLGDTW